MSALFNATPKESTGIRNADGAASPAFFVNGLPYDGTGALAVDTVSAITSYHQGLPFTANGRLAIAIDSPASFGGGAAPFNSGRLCLQEGAAASYVHGVAYNSASAVRATVL